MYVIYRYNYTFILPTFSPAVASKPATTITVGSGPPVDINVTPTISQSVELQCSRTRAPKQWYSTGSRVNNISGEVWTTGGPIKKLGFSTFSTSHAGTYSCLVKDIGEMNTTTYTVVLGKFVQLNVEHSCPIVYTYIYIYTYVQSYDSTHSHTYRIYNYGFKSRNSMYIYDSCGNV